MNQETKHIPFDLEWAKRGGIVCMMWRGEKRFAKLMRHSDGEFLALSLYAVSPNLFEGLVGFTGVYTPDTYLTVIEVDDEVWMATPEECAVAGAEYIEPPMRWQPIETAPNDTLVLVCREANTGCRHAATLIDREWIVDIEALHDFDSDACSYALFDKLSFIPTHWMPLPKPPTT